MEKLHHRAILSGYLDKCFYLENKDCNVELLVNVSTWRTLKEEGLGND